MATSIRFSQFNASLNRTREGELVTDLSTPNNAQARTVAEIIQRTNPDVLLINEFDYVAADPLAPVRLFQQNYLSVSQNGATPVDYPYVYIAPSNTGIASGFDLNNNGQVVTTPGTPGYGDDSFGFGNFPGQFGMVLLSKYPIDLPNVRTFQTFRWADMPGNLLTSDPTLDNPATPINENLGGFYSPQEQAVLRLSSKNHWDVPILVNGQTIHVLASHPTPPVFDGPEDRNGKRNFDEIRFWADYVTPGQGSYIYDDNGNSGGLATGSSFVIMGDQNADPNDGDSYNSAVLQLLQNPGINTNFIPSSAGAPQQAALQGNANTRHRSNPAFDTADFADGTPGNLRADYVLPSSDLTIADSAVFWPLNTDPLFPLVGTFNPSLPGGFPSSDHRLVWVDVQLGATPAGRTAVTTELLGQAVFPTSLSETLNGVLTQIGGLSGIVYDASRDRYYIISDDRGDRTAANSPASPPPADNTPPRFYTASIDPEGIATGVDFTGVTFLRDSSGNTFAPLQLDPEGIALSGRGTIFVSSEGEVNIAAGRVTSPLIGEFDLATGRQIRTLSVPTKFIPVVQDTNNNGRIDTGDTQTSGIRNNLAFESLTLTPDGRTLYTATENALFQDGAVASLTDGTRSRILQYNLLTGQPEKEYLYITDAVAESPVPAGSFSTNGLVELLALDNRGTLLALERSFSTGAGNTIRLYEISLQGATDISTVQGLGSLTAVQLAAIQPVQKRLLLDFDDLELPTGLDNIEGISFGPRLPNGQQTLIITSDNNFSATQFTQIIALSADIVPSVTPTVETRPALIDDPEQPDDQQGDADDPTIYVNPHDPSRSLVITVVKNAGLRVYDLEGSLVQEVNPGGIRYNNVDLQYGFQLYSAHEVIDIAVATDRNNDRLVIFKINAEPNAAGEYLEDITDDSIGTLFQALPFEPPYSSDERSAYGIALYRSPVTDDYYVFVNRRETGDVAQFKLVDSGNGTIGAERVRNFTVPIPAGAPADTDPQLEGMVVDQETGFLYIGQENVGIWKYLAEPYGGDIGILLDPVKELGGSNLEDDVEGLTIYYGPDGSGYLLASSQGDNTFAVYSRSGNNEFLGRFAVGANGAIDSVQESDGADVVNVPLGPNFPYGLFVTQDGSNDPAFLVEDDGELENASTNFKFVPWQNIANAFPEPLLIDTSSYDPRHPQFLDKLFEADPRLVTRGSDRKDDLTGTDRADYIVGGAGGDLIDAGTGNDIVRGGKGRDRFVLRVGAGIDTILDFEDGFDRLALADGLRFRQLTIAAGSGSHSDSTLISLTSSGEILATLTGIQPHAITRSDFAQIG
jgi:myo-inositol-hexaphosphate 3-phosphohydrolase